MKHIYLQIIIPLFCLLPTIAVACSAKLSDKNIDKFELQTDDLYVDTNDNKMWLNCRLVTSSRPVCSDQNSKISWFDLEVKLSGIKDNGLFGYKDWRMPTARELLKVVGEDCYVVNVAERRFSLDIPASYYWINKPYVLNSIIGYDVRNNHEYTIIGYYPHMERYVHLIRDM